VEIDHKHLAFVVPSDYDVAMKNISIPKYLLLAALTAGFAAGQTKTIKRIPAQPTAAIDGKSLFNQYARCATALRAKVTDLPPLR